MASPLEIVAKRMNQDEKFDPNNWDFGVNRQLAPTAGDKQFTSADREASGSFDLKGYNAQNPGNPDLQFLNKYRKPA